jgi:hypothetical protein
MSSGQRRARGAGGPSQGSCRGSCTLTSDPSDLLYDDISHQCKGCDRPFSIHEGDDPSEVTKCVFCRTDERNQQAEASSSGEESKDA